MRYLAIIAVVMAAGTANAGLDGSLRPVLRPGTAVLTEPAQQTAPAAEIDLTAEEPKAERGGLFNSLRPLLRSRKAKKAAKEQARQRAKGAVCGDPALQGEVVGRVKGKLKGCGADNAVRVRSVAGIALSQKAVMDCKTAKALKSWVNNSARPALAKNGGGLKSIKVVAHYSCRTRNNKKGAKISEHGRARAIDIAGFRLQNGKEISLLKGWNAKSSSRALRQMHKGACGPFGTVLGPNANRFHRDHFHFDTARYRSGTYCK